MTQKTNHVPAVQTCEHCDDAYTADGWLWSGTAPPRRVSCRRPAKCGTWPTAPHGWCCHVCEPTMRKMFGPLARALDE